MRPIIITADDFGLSLSVNEAVEQAHQNGVLRAASLMVGAPAADDAIERAKRLPGLRVGLHLTLVDGDPLLPPSEIPSLVDDAGRFHGNLVRAGIQWFFDPRARRDLAREIGAQLEAFARTGLALDHVNAHAHMHVHPTVLSILLKLAGKYTIRAIRLPREPLPPGATLAERCRSLGLAPWLSLMSIRLRRAGIVINKVIFGLRDTGAMDEAKTIGLIERMSAAAIELYFHPSTSSEGNGARELAALTSDGVAAALWRNGFNPGGYAEVQTLETGKAG